MKGGAPCFWRASRAHLADRAFGWPWRARMRLSAAPVSTESTSCLPTVSIPMQCECVRVVEKKSYPLGICTPLCGAHGMNGKVAVIWKSMTRKRCLIGYKPTANRPDYPKIAQRASRKISCASVIHSAAPGGHMGGEDDAPQADALQAGLICRGR